jgi:hypothetical protein
VSSSAGVAVVDTGHVQELLASGRRHKSGTTGSRNETNPNGATLSSDLAGDSVGHARHATPVSTADGRNVELGSRNGTANGSGNLRRALDAETNVSGRVTDGNERLETRALTGRRLLLDGHDLHHLVLELVLEEVVNNFGLLDGKGKKKYLFYASNLSFLDEASELGDRDPDVLFVAATTTATAAAATTTTASSTAAKASASFSSSFSSSFT